MDMLDGPFYNTKAERKQLQRLIDAGIDITVVEEDDGPTRRSNFIEIKPSTIEDWSGIQRAVWRAMDYWRAGVGLIKLEEKVKKTAEERAERALRRWGLDGGLHGGLDGALKSWAHGALTDSVSGSGCIST